MLRLANHVVARGGGWLRSSLLALLVAAALPAQAEVFDIADGDIAALRAALLTAQGNGEADTVNLATNGTYTFVDHLTASTGFRGALLVLGDEDAGHLLTINGNGATLQRSSAPGTPPFRILYVEFAALLVNDLIVKNGLASSEEVPVGDDTPVDAPVGGGGFLIQSSVELVRCVITDNHAVSVGQAQGSQVGAWGGGIVNYVGSLSLTDSQVTNNSATGPVFDPAFDPHLGVSDVFRSSTLGGGIFSFLGVASSVSPSIRISNSTITGNQAVGGANGGLAGAGGIFSGIDDLSVEDSTICGNVARGGDALGSLLPSGGGVGGGLIVINGATFGYPAFGTATISNTTFCNNSAQAGSPAEASNALGVIGFPSAGGGLVLAVPTTMDGCTINGNSAPGGRGGGLLTVDSPAFGAPASTIATNLNVFGNSALVNPDVDDPFIPEPPTATPTPTEAVATATPALTPTPTPGSCMPITEVCDGLDNDCDGEVDDHIEPSPCTPEDDPGGLLYGGTSQCQMGHTVCSGGNTLCQGWVGPSAEVCDDVDNDCDGTVDNTILPVPACTPTPSPSASTPTPTPSPITSATATPPMTPISCPPVHSLGCRAQTEPGRGRLSISDWHGRDDKKDRVEWAWAFGEATSFSDFGDPTAGTSSALCVYDGLDRVVFAASISGGNGWLRKGSSYLFHDGGAKQAGISKVILRARNGKGRLQVVGRGAGFNLGNSASGNLPDIGAFPIVAAPSPMRVQFVSSSGQCWESRFQTRIDRNATHNSKRSIFRARND